MNTIGIIGKGFVGNAVFEGMKHAFNIACYDKASGLHLYNKETNTVIVSNESSIEDGMKAVIDYSNGPVFICLPTPMNSDGSCNTDIVTNAVKMLDSMCKDRVFVIKSTVPPGTTLHLNEKCENRVCFNPEFLTERNSIEDFKNQDRIIVGGPREGTNVLKQMYETAYPDVPVTKTSSTVAELVKYTTNCFLATKVAFANEMKLICDELNEDYDKVVEYATKDKRLGSSHWAVPGPDGKVGFGGKCFCKDLNALMSLMRKHGVKPYTMEGAWESNLAIRPEKDWESIPGVIS